MLKKNIRLIVDITMFIIIPLLMAYSLIGEAFHKIAGFIMFVLLIIHSILNINWYKELFKGKYTLKRIYQTIINFLLLIFMLLQILSGILMSKRLSSFINITGMISLARSTHLLCAYWSYILIGMHAGNHLIIILSKFKNNKTSNVILMTILFISFYGIYAFIKRDFLQYMFMRSAFVYFDFSEPRIFFFLDYLSIIILFTFIGHLINTKSQKQHIFK